MAVLTKDDGVSQLLDDNDQPLTDDAEAVTSVDTFPLMLLMRLRLHAVLFWGTILLMQTIP